MKHPLLAKVLLIITISLFSTLTNAQGAPVIVKQKIVDLNGKPSFIEFNQNSIYNSNDDQKVFKEQLGLDNNSNFSMVKTEADNSGFVHKKFQLSHKGVKVEFATYSLHSKNGKLSSMSGEYYDIKETSTTPTISSETAFQKAINYIGASTYLWENLASAAKIGYKKPTAELVLLPSMADQGKKVDQQKVNLAYKFDIYATSPVSRGDIYIDAKTGTVLYYNATIKHLGEYSHGNKNSLKSINDTKEVIPFLVAANAATRYSATQSIQTVLSDGSYILSDATRGLGVQTFNMQERTDYATAVEFRDADNNWTALEFDNANKDNGALDAHWGAEKTYDYFKTAHQRNSFDNDGAAIKSYVHFNNAFNNAYWNGSVMTYGDGDGELFDVLTSLDVAAHEIGHAICEKTANLAYQKESGAMNEAFSDIWGACVEYDAAPTKSTWLIGEDIMKNGAAALRSMSDPKAQGQPDTYGGTHWQTIECGIPTQTNDYCGVHTNSGVLNHWFYILSIGKSGTNDINSQYNVTGITIEKAAKIAYRLESVYLSANSTYANARTYGIQAAADLYGAKSAEFIATTNAFYAVGVGAAYVDDNTPPSKPTNVTAAGTTGGSTNLSWNASTDNVGVAGYNVYNGETLLATANGTSYMVTGLTHRTTYSFTVKAKDDSQNLSEASAPLSVTTGNYCHSQGNQTDLLYIAKVELGGINNSSTATNGYSDFTALTTNLTKGVANEITITRFGNYSLGYTVHIDLNGDNDFEDEGELVWNKEHSETAPVSGSFTVPNTAKTGATRMRVSMGYQYSPTSCQDKNFSGEVEDYSVNIVTETTALPPPTNLIASATTSSSTNLSWTAPEDATNVVGYKVYKGGTLVYTAAANELNYTVNKLTSNTEYTFTVKSYDNAQNLSEASNPVTITTVAVDPPKNLTAAATTSSSTVLSWDAPDNAAANSYNVYANEVLVHNIDATETTYTVTGLNSSTEYTFTVKTIGSNDNLSAASNPATITTAAIAPPTNLTAAETTSSSTNLSWTAPEDATNVIGYKVYKGGTLEYTAAANEVNYTVNNLTSDTEHTFTVKSYDNAQNLSEASNPATITTATAPTTYCASKGNSVDYEYIKKVELGAINNSSSGGTGYSNFTNITTDIPKGSQNIITITPAWTGDAVKEGYAVWIDLNGDSDFEDEGELVWSKEPSFAETVSGSFTVPITAITGSTRMRVSMKYNEIPSSCETFSYGEVEDYSINIVEAPPTDLVASATTSSSTLLSWTASTDESVAGYNVYNGSEQVNQTTISEIAYTVTNLTSSTQYTFTVKAMGKKGDLSKASNAATITTKPSAATNLVASEITSTSTVLSWTASTDEAVTGYKIYKGDVLEHTTTGTEITHTVTGLTSSTQYAFTVKAIGNNSDLSEASNQENIITKPSAATTLTASATTASSTVLSWTPATDQAVTGYNVYNGSERVATAITGNSYTVNGLTSSTTYTFTVKAIGKNGDLSAASNTATITTKPSAATNLVASAITSTSTVLSWTASTDEAVTGYKVYKGDVLEYTTTGTEITYTVTGLASSTQYAFTVKAKDAAGNLSEASNQETITTKPSAATNLTAAETTSSSTVLSWTAPEDDAVTGYNVYNGSVIVATAITGTSYTVTALKSSTQYTFTVKAIGKNGDLSAASNPATITTAAIAPPTNLTAAETTSSSTVLSWTTPTDSTNVAGYNVYQVLAEQDPRFISESAYMGTTTANNYTVTELTSSTDYTFIVKAKDAAANLSEASNTATTTTKPSAATNLTAAATTSSSTVLSWTASTDQAVTAYNVYNGSEIVATANGTSYTVTELTSSTQYTFTVKAIGNNGDLSAASNPATITTAALAPPTNLTAAETTSSSTVLSWTPPADATDVVDYDIYSVVNQTATAVNNELEFVGTTDKSTYTVTGLTSSTQYTFIVKAKDEAGNLSEASNQETITTKPSAATNLTAAATTSSSTVLSWTASTDQAVTGYNVYNGAEIVATASGTSYTVTALTSSTQYTFTVKAIGNNGDLSAASNTATITTAALAPPTNLTAAETTSSSTVLSWIPPADATDVVGYNIYSVVNQVATAVNNELELVGTTDKSTYLITDLNSSNDYTFIVKAKDAAGNLSEASNTATTTTKPSEATNLTASATTSSSTVLSWTAPEDDAVTGYNVYNGAEIVATAITGTSYTATELTSSTQYTFTVKAIGNNGDLSAASNPATITTAALDTPTNLTAAETTSSSTVLSWTPPADATNVVGYNIYSVINLGPTAVNNEFELVGTTDTSTYLITDLNPSTNYTFIVKAKDAAGNLSEASNQETITTLPLTYCASKGNSVSYEYIEKVNLGTINNTSSGGTGYSDFTSITTDITKGSPNTITITPAWTSGSYPEGYAVWIDLNGDSDFDDADELVWSKAPSKTATVSGSFTLPNAATNGTTRMRVSMKYNGLPSSCEAFSYGEVEDYSVNIVEDSDDETPPSAPTNLTASGTTSSSTDLSWTASTGDVAVTGYNVYNGSDLVATTNGTSYTVTGLISGTQYTFTVKAKDTTGNLSEASDDVTITTKTVIVAPTYCDSQGNSISYEYIEKVELGSINNSSSGGTGYSDFTSITTNITKGSPNTITITPAWTAGSYPEGYAVWIDLNGDSDFDDAGELVWSKEPSKSAPVSGSFTIPNEVTNGTTRMRVSMKYNGLPSSCEAFPYGEVEDYSVNIVEGSDDENPPSAPTSLTASGTTSSSTDLSWTASTDDVAVTGYNVYSGSDLVASASGTSYTVTGLISGTQYSFTVKAQDAAGNLSEASDEVTITTAAVMPTYCASKGNSVSYEYIKKVTLGTINKSSLGGTGYSDFTNITTNITKGSQNIITITPAWTSGSYPEGYAVWIDLNGDSDFEDAGELVWSKAPSKAAPVSGSFTLPSAAANGTTRMRVSMKYNGIPSSCEAFPYGEVEDYSVNIVAGSDDALAKTSIEKLGNEKLTSNLYLYPNPADNILNVSMADYINTTYKIINLLGQQVGTGKLSESAIDINALDAGVYILEINNGQKTHFKKFVKN